MNWQEKAKYLLENHQVEGLAEWCEEGINSGNGGSFPYWYLGLVYLLQGNIEQAQGVWLSGLFEASGEEDSDQRTEGLVGVLESEAQRREELGELEVSVELRQHLQEINPSFNNLLKLVILSIQREGYRVDLLKQFNLLEAFQENASGEIDLSSVLQLIKLLIINLETNYEQEILQISISILKDFPHLMQEVLSVAIQNNFRKRGKAIACQVAETCLEYQPNLMTAHLQLAYLYSELGEHSKALEKARYLQDKFDNLSDQVQSKSLLLRGLLKAGDWKNVYTVADEYDDLVKQLIEENPRDLYVGVNHSIFLSSMYLPYLKDSPRENRVIHNQIGNLFSGNIKSQSPLSLLNHPKRSPSNRKLKIGYIGHTFRGHPVYWLNRWLIQNHNLDDFEVIIYSIFQNKDPVLNILETKVSSIRYLGQQTARAIVKQIQEDEIDILVDVDSITLPLTNEVLAYKPAPIQVTWLGWDASGLPTVDYYIADPYVLPENAQDYYQETIWRLANTYVAVGGFEMAIPTLERKQLNIPNEAIIYYSSQVALKRHPETIRLQLRILKAVPDSYFLIKGMADDPTIQTLFNKLAAEEGVNPNRLRFIPLDPTELTHRANLTIADVVLDTYPYNGATTTLETLWAGVPLVTRVGEQFSARNSYTFLRNAGVEEGIAWSDEEYVEWGVRLGTEEHLRKRVHWKLKESRKTAPLWKVEAFTREMEKAYQQMWERYIESE